MKFRLPQTIALELLGYQATLSMLRSFIPTKDYIRSMEKEQLVTLTPYDNFVYALKADETKRQYAQAQ